MSEEQARAKAKAYAQGLTNETAWKFKSMNDADLMKLKADLEWNKARIAKAKAAGKGKGTKDVQRIVNSVVPSWNRLPAGEMVESSQGTKGGGNPISNKEWNYLKDYIIRTGKLGYDANYGVSSDEDRKSGYGKYDLSNAMELGGGEYVRMKIPGTDKIEPMIKLKVTWAEDAAPEHIIDYGDNRHNMAATTKKVYNKEDEEWEEIDVITGHVYVPMGRETRSSTWRTGFNKNLGYHNRIDGGAPTVTNTMYAMDGFQDSQQYLEYLISLGATENEARKYMQMKFQQ